MTRPINRCEHIAWMQCANDHDKLFLHESFRFSKLVQNLPEPDVQTPGLITFYGKRNMQGALRQVFPRNNFRRESGRSLLNLRIDADSQESQFPVFFADGDLLDHESTCPRAPCHYHKAVPTSWNDEQRSNAPLALHARLAWLFTNVICIFAEDYGGIERVLDLLKTLIAFGSASSLPSKVRPSLVIVATSWPRSPTMKVLEQEAIHRMKLATSETLKNTFSKVQVLATASDTISNLARYRRLKEVLFNELDHGAQVRRENHALFSATYLEGFWNEAVEHTASGLDKTFDFILATRRERPVPQGLNGHLKSFLGSAWSVGCQSEAICRFIASALVMDALPLGSHIFQPEALFHTLYEAMLDDALRIHFCHDRTLVLQYSQSIKKAFVSFAFEIYRSMTPTAQLRAKQIEEASFVWTNLKTNRTCLLCLAKPPEHSLTCGHTICDDCLRLFGRLMPQLEHHYVLQYCNLCKAKGYVYARLKPPTAGIRMLTVDGGGICGVIPLQFLSMLQDKLGNDLAIQDLFDAAFGTSAGGLIVLGLFVQGWSVRTCMAKFTNLGQQLFATKGRAPWQLLSKLGDIFWCLLSDGHYDVQVLDSLLQENFGKEDTLFGANHQLVSGLKIGVTATTTSSASACLFANYNGSYSRGIDCGNHAVYYPTAFAKSRTGYKVVQGSLNHEPRIWEAARATSAAPVLFTPVHIPTVGTFQDGGLRHNNPIKVALNEVKQIWPRVTSDFVLSLGTGKEAESPTSTSPLRSRFRDGFIPRLLRSLIYSLNTENAWRELMNHLDEASKASYVRLNIPFRLGEKIRLDDTSKIEYLMSSVREQKGLVQQQRSIVLSLLASCFYFELKRKPFFQGGYFEISGFLKCRADARKLLRVLYEFSSSVQVVTELASFGQLDETCICSTCHRLVKPLKFQVANITDIVKIELATEEGDHRQISGSPNSMQWYIKQQRLDFSFSSQSSSQGSRNCGNCCAPPTRIPFIESVRSGPKRHSSNVTASSRKRRKAWEVSLLFLRC